MKLLDIKAMFGVQNIEVKKFKEEGAYSTTLGKGKDSVSLFVTKATDINSVNDESLVTLIDGKFYIGVVKEALDTKTI